MNICPTLDQSNSCRIKVKEVKSWALWHMTVIFALRRHKKEQGFEITLTEQVQGQPAHEPFPQDPASNTQGDREGSLGQRLEPSLITAAPRNGPSGNSCGVFKCSQRCRKLCVLESQLIRGGFIC